MTDTKKSKQGTNFLFLTIFFLSIALTNCDLPVHCVFDDFIGQWVFRINNEKFNPKLNDPQTSCGHQIPNNSQAPIGENDFNFDKFSNLIVELKKDFKVYHENQVIGEWTSVYDQSIYLKFVKDGKTAEMTSPFKYFKPNENTSPISDCSKTMIGWFIPDINNKDKNWSCFFGFQKKDVQNFLQISSSKTNVPVFTQIKTSEPDFSSHLRYEHLQPFVNKVNEMDLSWKAHMNQDFIGLNFIEIREKLGLRRGLRNSLKDLNSSFIQIEETEGNQSHVVKFLNELEAELTTIKKPSNKYVNIENNQKRDDDSKNVDDFTEIGKYLGMDIKNIDEKTLPRNWDWRDVGGVDYTAPVGNQGDCGSCYVWATISSLEGRLRVMTNMKDTTRFSKQFPLSCNFYSEGCEGGFPFLVGKFFNDFEIIPEKDFPSSSNPSRPKCSELRDFTKNKKKYTVSKYEYLGGHYGVTSEIDMMKELRARGPIPGSIKVPVPFNYYKSGIFSLSDLFKNNQNLSKVTQLDRAVSWEKVEHSITVIGYGEENGVKYWILQNTWGTSWGENGFFRLLRGENELSIESMGDIVHLKIEDRDR
jgi:C1A family cysteine protease